MPSPRAAYVHVPFCRHHCGYCNFTVMAGGDDRIPAYLQAIALEMAQLESPRQVDTLFFGGGTPTHLNLEQLGELLELTRRWFPAATGHEWSVEANPADLTLEKARLLAEAGVTRISLGVQSFDEAKLQTLERDHRREQIVSAAAMARRFFESVSLDLIFAAPGESLEVWKTDLTEALKLQPDHISTYGLTYERGAAFWGRRARGELAQVEEQAELSMYAAAIDYLTGEGFEHYEVSNFAIPGKRCRHNETYWLGGEYYAIGPGAARYVDGARETNHRSTSTYIKRVLSGQSPVAESERLQPRAAACEKMIFALRRLEGIDCREFARQCGFQVEELAGEAIEKFIELGLLEKTRDRLRLTRRGLMVSDSLWPEFLADA